MNQIIKTKQFSPKQNSNRIKNQSLNLMVSPTFYGKNIEILKF